MAAAAEGRPVGFGPDHHGFDDRSTGPAPANGSTPALSPAPAPHVGRPVHRHRLCRVDPASGVAAADLTALRRRPRLHHHGRRRLPGWFGTGQSGRRASGGSPRAAPVPAGVRRCQRRDRRHRRRQHLALLRPLPGRGAEPGHDPRLLWLQRPPRRGTDRADGAVPAPIDPRGGRPPGRRRRHRGSPVRPQHGGGGRRRSHHRMAFVGQPGLRCRDPAGRADLSCSRPGRAAHRALVATRPHPRSRHERRCRSLCGHRLRAEDHQADLAVGGGLRRHRCHLPRLRAGLLPLGRCGDALQLLQLRPRPLPVPGTVRDRRRAGRQAGGTGGGPAAHLPVPPGRGGRLGPGRAGGAHSGPARCRPGRPVDGLLRYRRLQRRLRPALLSPGFRRIRLRLPGCPALADGRAGAVRGGVLSLHPSHRQ